MSLPRNNRARCKGDGFDVTACSRIAKFLDGVTPRCWACRRRRERTLRRIEEGERNLEDDMLRKNRT